MHTPLGELTLVAQGDTLCSLSFGRAQRMDDSKVLMDAQRELEEYFSGRRKSFSVPICMQGTAFQMRVWAELVKIPYGETISYGELAGRVGNARACRAVGQANHVNPIPIIVPCHRVLSANGRLTGYAGGTQIKRRLLEIEGVYVEV